MFNAYVIENICNLMWLIVCHYFIQQHSKENCQAQTKFVQGKIQYETYPRTLWTFLAYIGSWPETECSQQTYSKSVGSWSGYKT